MNEVLAFSASFIAMALIVSSYFFKKKSLYLEFQGLGILFLAVSYLFSGLYFAMIGLSIGLARTLVYFVYENKDKVAPLWLAFLFSGLTFLSYFIVNLGILQTVQILDIVYLLSLLGYIFVFRERDLKTVRFGALVPTILSIIYNAMSGAAIFAVISYAFELAANILSIIQNYVIKNPTQTVGEAKTNKKS